MPPKAFVVVNPVAGHCNPDTLIPLVKRKFESAGWAYDIYETTGQEDLPALVAETIDDSTEVCIAAGGDGTLAEVGNGLQNSEVPLGVLPVGTSNALARELNIPLEPEEALELIINAPQTRVIDGIEVADSLFFMNIGIGFTASTIKATSRDHKRVFGRLAYLWAAFKELVGLHPRPFTIKIGQQRIRTRATEVLIFNGSAPGGFSIKLEPSARLDDGFLHVYIVSTKTLLDHLRLMLSLLRGQHKRNPHVHYIKTDEAIEIDIERKLAVHADGELFGETPLKAWPKPHVLPIITPAG